MAPAQQPQPDRPFRIVIRAGRVRKDFGAYADPDQALKIAAQLRSHGFAARTLGSDGLMLDAEAR